MEGREKREQNAHKIVRPSWIFEILSDLEMRVTSIEEAAEARGIKPRTLVKHLRGLISIIDLTFWKNFEHEVSRLYKLVHLKLLTEAEMRGRVDELDRGRKCNLEYRDTTDEEVLGCSTTDK